MVFNAFHTYCSAVCVVVRWKRYHAPITAELTAHMEDHADYLIAKGMEPDEAAAHAVAAMGDPYNLGKELDKLHSPWYPRLTRVFTVLAALLLLVSVFLRLSNGSAKSYPVFAPFATAQQALASYPYLPGTVLSRGEATGGGSLGAYHFTGQGAAVLYRADYDKEDGLPVYQLFLGLPTYTPFFWLEGPNATYLPCRLDGTESDDTSSTPLDMGGVFRRNLLVMLDVEPPFQTSYTFSLGPDNEVSYTVTLEGVTAP